MLAEFNESFKEMVDKWEEILTLDGSPREIDVWPFIQNATCDVISRSAFGSNYAEGKRIFEILKEQAEHAMIILFKLYLPGFR